MACRQSWADWMMQVSITSLKPTSLPPAVTETSVVAGLSADSWWVRMPRVVAPEQAANVNEAGWCARAHCGP
jgi:hypothetical protein